MQLYLEQTCSSCPEQYDVWDGPFLVGYLRLRHGVFSVHTDAGSPALYAYHFADPWKGAFDSEDERQMWLAVAKGVLGVYYASK